MNGYPAASFPKNGTVEFGFPAYAFPISVLFPIFVGPLPDAFDYIASEVRTRSVASTARTRGVSSELRTRGV